MKGAGDGGRVGAVWKQSKTKQSKAKQVKTEDQTLKKQSNAEHRRAQANAMMAGQGASGSE